MRPLFLVGCVILFFFSGSVVTANPVILARLSKHAYNVTGDESSYTPIFDEIRTTGEITYDFETGHFRVPESGLYAATWSLPVGNLYPSNVSGAAWLKAGTDIDSFIYNGNPWAMRNPGGVPGGGGDVISIVGSRTFYVDAELDPRIWITIRIGGHSRKNILLLYDSFFSLRKVGDFDHPIEIKR